MAVRLGSPFCCATLKILGVFQLEFGAEELRKFSSQRTQDDRNWDEWADMVGAKGVIA